ncbi:cobalamin-5'-phosphate synthase [Pseudonocardia endophytica]|uniref:Adenosylcobinamide-GDP ribazoletransferase n=1 Tax=Pseudonocardia endophytica TaxID=401976 RepID=A0A4R1HLF8_PSEEN|nr:cobalamin-5'-phosphate synthase [Pseudonocardia endophytica]
MLVAARLLGVPAAVAAALAVGTLLLTTRGMHLDGLADTADGLGCYGPPERALTVMRSGPIGPFGVATIVVVLAVQMSALAALPVHWSSIGVVAWAGAVGRSGLGWCCRRGVPAARPDGMGALVADAQPAWTAPAWWTALAVVGAVTVPGVTCAPIAVLGAAAVVVVLSGHVRRRLGGMNGDVLGAVTELGTTVALVAAGSGLTAT